MVDKKKTALDLVKNTLSENSDKKLLTILDDSFSDYSDMVLTEEEEKKLSSSLRRISTGASSFTVLNCRGAECPFAARCPLVQMDKTFQNPSGKAPVGKDCILESHLIREAAGKYYEEYNVDPNSFTEINIVSELAEIEVLLWRINMQISTVEHSLLIIDQTIGFDSNNGEPIVQKQVSPLFEQKQKLNTRKSKLIKLMVGDRQEKYKKEAALKIKPSDDASSQMADLRKKLTSIQGTLDKPTDAVLVSPEDFITNNKE